MTLLRPVELMKIKKVSKRFERPQQIGWFAKIYSDKFFCKRVNTTVFIDKDQFLTFLTHIEKAK